MEKIEIKIVNGKAIAKNEFSAIVLDMVVNNGEGDVKTFEMPADELDNYLPRLVRAGFRCQIELDINNENKTNETETETTVKNVCGAEVEINGEIFNVVDCGRKNAILKRINGGGLTRIKAGKFLTMANQRKINFCNR